MSRTLGRKRFWFQQNRPVNTIDTQTKEAIK